MGARNKTSVRLAWPDGGSIDYWTSFELRDTYTDPLGSLRFQYAPPREQTGNVLERLRPGQFVTLFVNDVNQGGYLITTVDTKIGPNGITHDFQCKTPLCTPYEGSVDPDLQVSTQTDTPIAEVILKALAPYGFDRISTDGAGSVGAVTGRSVNGGRNPFPVDVLKQQEAHANEGESAYQFCARLFTRLGVCLRMAPDGQLLLGAPDYDQQPMYALAQDPRAEAPGDYFFGDIDIHWTNDGQFSECKVRGQADDKSGKTSTARPEATVKSSAINATSPPYTSTGAVGASGAAYKPLIKRDKNARDAKRCESVALFELGLRAKEAFHVTGTVDGFVAKTGAIWQVNTTVDVFIDAYGINQKMWVGERVLMQDAQGGQRTRLRLHPLNYIVLGSSPGSA